MMREHIHITVLTVSGVAAAAAWVRVCGCPAHSPAPSAGPARVNLVHPAVLRLHVFDLLDILQAVDSATEVDFPHSGVTVCPVFARVDGPLPEQCCVPLPTIAPLLSMDPGDFENSLLLIEPFQSDEFIAVDHSVL